MDRYNDIVKKIIEEFTTEVSTVPVFNGIQIYLGGIPTEGIHFPSAVIRRGKFGISEYFVGGGSIDYMDIAIDIGFTPKNTAVSDDSILYENDALTSKFGSAMREFVNRINNDGVLDEMCSVDRIVVNMEPKYIVDGDLNVFGLSSTITIYFEGE
jgi:hypothetical protein